jgi:hypothetical protein
VVLDPFATYRPGGCTFLEGDVYPKHGSNVISFLSFRWKIICTVHWRASEKNQPLSGRKCTHYVSNQCALSSLLQKIFQCWFCFYVSQWVPTIPRDRKCASCAVHITSLRERRAHTHKRGIAIVTLLHATVGAAAMNSSTGSDASSHTVGCDADAILFGVFINISEMKSPSFRWPIIISTKHSSCEIQGR